MLTDCYHVKGKRHTKYRWAVLHIMASVSCEVVGTAGQLLAWEGSGGPLARA